MSAEVVLYDGLRRGRPGRCQGLQTAASERDGAGRNDQSLPVVPGLKYQERGLEIFAEAAETCARFSRHDKKMPKRWSTLKRWLRRLTHIFTLAAGCLASGSAPADVEQLHIDLISIYLSCGDWSQDIVIQEIRKRGYYNQSARPGPFWKGPPCGELVQSVLITSTGTIRITGWIAEPGQHFSNKGRVKRRAVTYELIPDIEPDGTVSWDFQILPMQSPGSSLSP